MSVSGFQPHNEPHIDAALDDIKGKIADHGWAVVGVLPAAEELPNGEPNPLPDGVPFAYTVGLTEAGLPELFVNGLPHHVAHYMINQVAKIALGRQVELTDGDQLTAAEVELSVDVRIAACHDNRHLGVARALYGRQKVQSLQVLWPDPQGRWPNETCFHGRQPLGPAD